ncbi:hypothetical protein GCM10009547_10860 [Sporichthya brevicatena]|uniref:DUF4878 domain-containing protein n=1 Tax=Sporichthya brevicatena TaxID=171442 RepID=A0ABN1GFY4_9ACTN
MLKQLSRPQLITAGVVAAVVLGAGVTLAVSGGGGNGSDNSGNKPGLEEAAAVAEALGKLADDPANLVASDVRSAIGGRAREAVPAGSTVSANPATWQPDGLGGGTMTVTVTSPGQPAVTYTAVMVKEQSGWKVVGTVPMNPANAGSTPAEPGQAPAANPPGVAQVPPGGATIPSSGAGVIPPGAPAQSGQPQGTQPQGTQPAPAQQQPAAPGGGQ